jgi:hypothetical protein
VVANVRDRLSVSKREAQMFDIEGYNPKQPNEMVVTEQYQVKVSNTSETLKNSDNS